MIKFIKNKLNYLKVSSSNTPQEGKNDELSKNINKNLRVFTRNGA